MTKVKYEKIGTVDVTVADIAFIGQMFAVTNYLGKHPEIMAGNIDLIGELAQMSLQVANVKHSLRPSRKLNSPTRIHSGHSDWSITSVPVTFLPTSCWHQYYLETIHHPWMQCSRT